MVSANYHQKGRQFSPLRKRIIRGESNDKISNPANLQEVIFNYLKLLIKQHLPFSQNAGQQSSKEQGIRLGVRRFLSNPFSFNDNTSFTLKAPGILIKMQIMHENVNQSGFGVRHKSLHFSTETKRLWISHNLLCIRFYLIPEKQRK